MVLMFTPKGPSIYDKNNDIVSFSGFENEPNSVMLKFIPCSVTYRNYLYVKYSTNGGKTWKYIYTCNETCDNNMEKYYHISELSYRVHSTDSTFDSVKKQFSTLSKIKEYENQQRILCKEKNDSLNKSKKQAKDEYNKMLDRINKPL